MTNTITLTDEQMKEFQSTGSITLKMPEKKVEKWEPRGGKVYVQGSGETYIFKCIGASETAKTFGTVFETQELAEEALPLMRRNNRLIQFVQEHGGIQEPVYGKKLHNWTVRKVDGKYEAGSYSSHFALNEIFMTRECAELLADKLNKGEVEL